MNLHYCHSMENVQIVYLWNLIYGISLESSHLFKLNIPKYEIKYLTSIFLNIMQLIFFLI